MKKFIYTFLIAALIITNALVVNASNEVYYTNNKGIQMNEKEYNNLLGLGFTEDQIASMSTQTFMDNKDIEATLVSEVVQYYKTTTVIVNGIQYHTSKIISEEEMLDEMQKHAGQNTYLPRTASGYYYNGLAYDDYKSLTTRIAYQEDDLMRLKLDVHWFTMPIVRSLDIMGIGFEADKVQQYSSAYFIQTWHVLGGNFGDSESCYPKNESTGVSVMFELPSGQLTSLESSMYFTVAKKTGVNTVYSFYASGDYAHATTSVSNAVYNYFSINYGTGLVIDSPYHNSYDAIDISQAMFAGTW